MAATVNQRGNPRSETLLRRIARLEPEPAAWRPLRSGWSTRCSRADAETLGTLRSMRSAMRGRAPASDEQLLGWLDAAIAFAHWGLERAPSPAGVARGTQAHEFLSVLDGSPPAGQRRPAPAARDRRDPGQPHRPPAAGERARHPAQGGPPGVLAADPARAACARGGSRPTPPDSSSFWQEALRRGFESAAGDEPGAGRSDPRADHRVRAGAAQHPGIQATTWQEVGA